MIAPQTIRMRVIETALEEGTPEEKARRKIDQLLIDAGWAVQDRDTHDPRASRGIAVRLYVSSPSKQGVQTISFSWTDRLQGSLKPSQRERL